MGASPSENVVWGMAASAEPDVGSAWKPGASTDAPSPSIRPHAAPSGQPIPRDPPTPIPGTDLSGGTFKGLIYVTGPCGLVHWFTRKEAEDLAAWLKGKANG